MGPGVKMDWKRSVMNADMMFYLLVLGVEGVFTRCLVVCAENYQYKEQVFGRFVFVYTRNCIDLLFDGWSQFIELPV